VKAEDERVAARDESADDDAGEDKHNGDTENRDDGSV
jgi:hypothetical protein